MNEAFDLEVRNRIYPVESDVPDHLWETVDLRLRPRSRKRWIFLPLVLLTLVSVWIIKLMEANDLPPQSQKSVKLNSLPMFASPGTSGSDRSSLSGSTELTEADLPVIKSPVLIRHITRQMKASPLTLTSEDNPENLTTYSIDKKVVENKVTDGFSYQESDIRQNQMALSTVTGKFGPVFRNWNPKLQACPAISTPSIIVPFLELNLSGGLPLRHFNARDPEVASTYLTTRRNTERTRTSFGVQGLAGIQIGDHLEVKSGLGLLFLNEVFDYIDEKATRTITNIITDTIFVNGSVVIRRDTSTVIQYGQRIKLTQNRYSFLDIPLFVGHRFPFRNQLFFVQAGAILNLKFWKKGNILSPDDQILDLQNQPGSEVYRLRSGWDLQLGIGYEREFSERNFLRIQAIYRQNMQDLTDTPNVLGQKYRHFHIGLSLKHQLQ